MIKQFRAFRIDKFEPIGYPRIQDPNHQRESFANFKSYMNTLMDDNAY